MAVGDCQTLWLPYHSSNCHVNLGGSRHPFVSSAPWMHRAVDSWAASKLGCIFTKLKSGRNFNLKGGSDRQSQLGANDG